MSRAQLSTDAVHRVSFVAAYDGPVVIEHVPPSALADPDAAQRSCRRLSRALGGLPVIQRSAAGNAMLFGGDPSLRRFAADPVVDCLPVVELAVRVPLAAAA
jgi:hypothetical protein